METINISKKVFDLYNAVKPFKDKYRDQLNCVHLNEKNMYVTNGHFLIESKKCDDLSSNINVRPLGKWINKTLSMIAIPFTFYQEKKGVSPAGDQVELVGEGRDYPDCSIVLNSLPKQGEAVIGLNAEYLLSIAEYLNRDAKKDKNIFLHINSNDLSQHKYASQSIRVTGNDPDSVGVIMPIREK